MAYVNESEILLTVFCTDVPSSSGLGDKFGHVLIICRARGVYLTST